MGAHTCIPSLDFLGNLTKSKPDTAVRGGLGDLLSSYPALIQTEMGKKGLDEPGISCTEAGRELCCSAQKKPSVALREGAELCCQTCSRCQKCRAELLSVRLL